MLRSPRVGNRAVALCTLCQAASRKVRNVGSTSNHYADDTQLYLSALHGDAGAIVERLGEYLVDVNETCRCILYCGHYWSQTVRPHHACGSKSVRRRVDFKLSTLVRSSLTDIALLLADECFDL